MSDVQSKNPDCRRCGACCHVDMVAYVTPEDTERWEREGRHDITSRMQDNEVVWSGDRVVRKSGAKVTSCSYLVREGAFFSCDIYETRPMVCRNFTAGSSKLCPLYYQED